MLKDESLPFTRGATNLVFGVGSPDTKILFIGEGPGYWEDQKGEPFVGNAGKLLNSLIQSIKLSREDVYITNVVHHRPPNNRDPEPGEIEALRYKLERKGTDRCANVSSRGGVKERGGFKTAKRRFYEITGSFQ